MGCQMNRCNLLVAIIGLTFAAGCASVNTTTADSGDSGTVVTGSRIPVRVGATTGEVKTTRDKNAIDDMMRQRNIYIPPTGGS